MNAEPTITPSAYPAIDAACSAEETPKPTPIGLGVSSAAQAASIAGYADGVIVGSAFIRRVLDAESSAEATAEVGRFAVQLREGVGRSTHLAEPDA